MAVVNKSGGAISTGNGATAVTVEKTQQVYGISVPISSGQRAIYGRVVWMGEPIVTTIIDVPAGGPAINPPVGPGTGTKGIPIDGKGHGIGLGQSHYDVTADFAVAFGYHLAPAADRAQTGILKMWANDKIIYDASDPSLKTDGVDFKFYDGSATQAVDSEIEADRDTLAPGFHNLIYVRFSKYHLTPASNGVHASLPVIKVEMIDGLVVSTEEHTFEMLPSATIWERGTSFDWKNDTIYAISDVSANPAYILSFSIQDEIELGKIPIVGTYDNLLGFNQISVFDEISGSLITAKNGINNTDPIVAVNVGSGIITGEFGVVTTNLHPSDINGVETLGTGKQTSNYPWPVTGDIVYVNDLERTQGVFAFSDTFNDLCLLPIAPDGKLPALVGTELSIPSLTSTVFGAVGQRASITLLSPGNPVASLNFGAAITFVKTLAYPGGASSLPPGQDGAVVVGVGSKLYTVYFGMRAGQIEISAIALGYDFGAGHLISQALIDPNDTGLVLFERTTGGSNLWTATKFRGSWFPDQPHTDFPPKVINWRGAFPEAGMGMFIGGTPKQIMWQVSVSAMSDEYSWQNAMHNSEMSAETFAWKTPGGSNTTILNLANGSTTTVAFAPSTTGAGGDFAWDSRTRKFYYPSHGGSFAREMWTTSLGYATGAVKTIGDYLRWIALKIGFLDANIYVDPQLTDPVIGMLIDHAYNSGTLFNDLGMLYDFQYFESENKIKFVRATRGDAAPAVLFDLTKSDLVKVNENTITSNDLFVTSLGEQNKTVANVTVGYDDFDLNYNWATQTYIVDKKTSGALGVGSLVLQTPVVMHRREAYRRASQVAIRENASADTHFFRLSQKYMRLEPSDVVAVTIAPFRYKIRIDEGTLNADWTTSYSGINYSYQDNIPDPTDTHVGVMDTSFGANDAKPLVFDVPLLYTNLNTTGIIMMVGVQSYAQANFAGSDLYAGVVPPGILEAVHSFPAGATVGILVGNCLPTTATPFQTDETSVVTVALRTGTSADFTSTDATGLLNGSNAILVGAAGRWEYVFFRDVTVVNSKVVKLSGLERGRRGTDVMTDLHAGGDQVVLVKSVADNFIEPLYPQFLESDAIETLERYQAHGAQNVRVIVTLDVGIRGYSLAPWDPVQQNMVLGSTVNAFASPDYGNLCGGGGNATPSGVDRRKYITVTGSPIARPEKLVDGDETTSSAHSAQYFVSVGNATILYDFHKSGFQQRITELQWMQNTTHNQGNYDFEGSNDGVAWTSIRANFDLVNGSASNISVFTNANYYWYYRLRQVSGTTSIFPWLEENYFKIVANAGANDLLIRWIRRDRVGDEWVTTPQPMSEATEQYDLEILNGSTIVRTVTGLTLPQYTYLAADQSTDGFAPPLASLRIKVYQVSAVSGRGFVGDATIYSA